MNFEVYTKMLSTINRKKLLKLDSETSIIFQKKFNVGLYMYKKAIYSFDEKRLNDFLNFLRRCDINWNTM